LDVQRVSDIGAGLLENSGRCSRIGQKSPRRLLDTSCSRRLLSALRCGSRRSATRSGRMTCRFAYWTADVAGGRAVTPVIRRKQGWSGPKVREPTGQRSITSRHVSAAGGGASDGRRDVSESAGQDAALSRCVRQMSGHPSHFSGEDRVARGQVRDLSGIRARWTRSLGSFHATSMLEVRTTTIDVLASSALFASRHGRFRGRRLPRWTPPRTPHGRQMPARAGTADG
jgi:hypothetical protein